MLKNKLYQSGFDEEQASIFSTIFVQELSLSRGDYFLKEGRSSDKLGIITTGMCRYFYHTEEDEVTRWISLSEDFITGLSSFISQKPSHENIQALTDTEIIFAKRKDFFELMNKHDFIQKFWLKSIENNYIGMEERLFNTISKSARERYEWMLKSYPRFNLEVPDKYVASMLGMKPRHLTRIRNLQK